MAGLKRGVAVAALIALVVGGCGGSDPDASDSDGQGAAPSGQTDRRDQQADEGRATRTSEEGQASERRGEPEDAREAQRQSAGGDRQERDRIGGRDDRERGPAGEERAPRTGPTKRSFIRAADRICTDFGRRESRLRKRASSTLRGQAAYLRRLADVVEDTAERLGELEAPAGDGRTIERYVVNVEGNAALLRRLSRALTREDSDEADQVSRKIRANGIRATRIAKRYGFQVCGGQARE